MFVKRTEHETNQSDEIPEEVSPQPEENALLKVKTETRPPEITEKLHDEPL